MTVTGDVESPCQWDGLRSFEEGLARVTRDLEYGFLDRSGTLVIPCRWGILDSTGRPL